MTCSRILVLSDAPCTMYVHIDKYSSGPNKGVVLNKRVGLIFCSPFIGENECFGKISYLI